MFRSIRWRLIISYMFLALLVVGAVGAITYQLAENYIEFREVEGLRANAQAIALQAEPLMRTRFGYLDLQQLTETAAFLGDVQSNEYNLICLSTARGPVGVKQIAGILARRIVCWPDLGDELSRGQRLGLIKFGSRVDLLLPPEVEVLVQLGQQVYGGQTIVGRWPRN